MAGPLREDAERIARRFHEVGQTFTPISMAPRRPWDESSEDYKKRLVDTFYELLQAELIFPGPSLYAESSV
jgi:hypothetical protein